MVLLVLVIAKQIRDLKIVFFWQNSFMAAMMSGLIHHARVIVPALLEYTGDP
jgi:hypothetical protein